MSSEEKTISLTYELIKDLIGITGRSVRKAAIDNGIDQANLSRFLKGDVKRVGQEKVARLADYLGLTLEGNLKSGVHRWFIASLFPKDLEHLSVVTQILLPGGVIITPIRSNMLSSVCLYALSPIKFLSVRILLSIDSLSSEKLKSSRSGEQERSLHLSDLGRGSMWFQGIIDEEEPTNCFIRLNEIGYKTIQNPNLTVLELDKVIGFNHDSNFHPWTKERLIEELDARGISYTEAAQKLGLSQ